MQQALRVCDWLVESAKWIGVGGGGERAWRDSDIVRHFNAESAEWSVLTFPVHFTGYPRVGDIVAILGKVTTRIRTVYVSSRAPLASRSQYFFHICPTVGPFAARRRRRCVDTVRWVFDCLGEVRTRTPPILPCHPYTRSHIESDY